MRCFAFLLTPVCLLIPFSLAAQSAAQSNDSSQRVTEALIAEMQQLRLAIERSTLLGARTQLSISQLQLSETALSRASQQYNDVHSVTAAASLRRTQLAERIKTAEQDRSTTTDQQHRSAMDEMLRGLKFNLDEATANEQMQTARETEVMQQLQAAQAQIAESRNRIAEMERMLDTAIQQLLKAK